jgi:hypothetical protein
MLLGSPAIVQTVCVRADGAANRDGNSLATAILDP